MTKRAVTLGVLAALALSIPQRPSGRARTRTWGERKDHRRDGAQKFHRYLLISACRR